MQNSKCKIIGLTHGNQSLCLATHKTGLRLQNPTDAAERKQKPSLAWIMPSREEEKPPLRWIKMQNYYLIVAKATDSLSVCDTSRAWESNLRPAFSSTPRTQSKSPHRTQPSSHPQTRGYV